MEQEEAKKQIKEGFTNIENNKLLRNQNIVI